MHTPKGRMSLEVPQRVSPRAARQLKTAVSESDSLSSSSQANRTPKERSPKVVERRSPRSPASSEKKRPHRISELEYQILQLQGDLKKARDELCSCEAWRKQAEQDAEKSGKQISGLSTKLEEAQRQILFLSSDKSCVGEFERNSCEESQVGEFERNSKEKEQAWQAELKAVKKQHLVDSSALASAANEISRLKNELKMVADSEAAQKEETELVRMELKSLKGNLAETVSLVENMKSELKDSRESEAQARALINDTLTQLESAKATVEALRADRIKATESYKSIASELDQSRARTVELQGIVRRLEASLTNTVDKALIQDTHETEKLKENMKFLEFEVERLRSVHEDAEAKNHNGDKDGVGCVNYASGLIGKMKFESAQREAELVAEIARAKVAVEDLNARLMDKETELQGILEENEGLNSKLEKSLPTLQNESASEDIKKLKEELLELKTTVMEREVALQHIAEENEAMKSDIKKGDEIVAELEVMRKAEKEAQTKVNLVMEEVEKSNKRAARATEQLEASQASASEMESELRRLKVQSDQWRKAAEAAAAMISVGGNGNGKYMDRTASPDSGYMNARIGSPYAHDMDDDLTKKKNGSVLKKIGVLWKKPQK